MTGSTPSWADRSRPKPACNCSCLLDFTCMQRRFAGSIGACGFNSLRQKWGSTRTVKSERNPRSPRGSSRTVALFIPAGSFPASHNTRLFFHVWSGEGTFGCRVGLQACCMGCCGDDVGATDDVSWSTALPNQKQDKWKSSKQSCCQEHSLQHLSEDSAD